MSSTRVAILRRGLPVARAGLDLLFPPRCAFCTAPVAVPDHSFCETCEAKVRAERAVASCPRCAASVSPYEVRDGRCGRCRRRRFYFSAVVRAGPYGDALGALFRLYKYEGRVELRALLGGWLASAVERAPWLPKVEAVVAVPTHWRRRLWREEYPADMLAEAVSRRLDLPLVRLLRRIRLGQHQWNLGERERRRNVRGAFAVRKGVTLNGPCLLLVDDVKTTGATLNEAARMLRQGGAKEVYGAVLLCAGWEAHSGPPPLA